MTTTSGLEPAGAPVELSPRQEQILGAVVERFIASGTPVKLRGIAFDGGSGIREVGVSTDGGATWTKAELGSDAGRYAFREWRLPMTFATGSHDLMVRATGNGGDTQPVEPLWNPAGYLRNAIETVRINAAEG